MHAQRTLVGIATISAMLGLSACMLLADFSGYGVAGGDAGPTVDAGPNSPPESEPDSGTVIERPPPLSYQIGGAFQDTLMGMDLDDDGNAYLLGAFKGEINLGGMAYKVNADEQGLFLVKVDPSGILRWSKLIAITADAIGFYADVRVNGGNPVIVGSFSKVVDVGKGLTSSFGVRDLFIASVSAEDGKVAWGKTFGAPGATAAALGVGVGASGRIAVTGYFVNTSVDLGDGCVMTTGDTTETPFAAALDPQGKCLWAKAPGGVGDAFGNQVAVDSADAVIFSGRFKGDIALGGSAGTLAAKSVDPIADGYLIKLDAAGAPVFGELLAPMATVRLHAAGEDVLLAGTLTDKLWYDPLPAVAGGADMMIARFGPDGAPAWSQLFGSAGEDSVALAIDPRGGFVIAGSIQGQVAIGSELLANAGGSDAFVGALDAAGKPLSGAKRFGDAADQVIDVVRVDRDNSPIVAGHFQGTIDLGTGPLTSRGGSDIFVARLAPVSR